MFRVSVETHFWASHQLSLPDGSKEPLHRHNWSVTADVSSEKLNKMGLVMDFHRLKALVDNIVAKLENTSLDKTDYFRTNNPSAENVARYIYERLGPKLPGDVKLEAIRVVEEPGCSAKFWKKNEAIIHLTEIVEGVRTEMHVCEHCAAEQGIAVKTQIPINELLSSLLSVQPTDDKLFGLSDEELSCPHCGFSLDKLREEAVLGCPHDYELFEKSLLPLIKKAHNGQTAHCGKVPSKVPRETKKQISLLNLRKQLEAAVQSENYELAAELRDKIEHMQKLKRKRQK